MTITKQKSGTITTDEFLTLASLLFKAGYNVEIKRVLLPGAKIRTQIIEFTEDKK